MKSIYRANVISNTDPLNRGRVKALIPELWGLNPQTNDLPWIDACSPFPGFADAGTFFVPDVGEWLWVIPTEGQNYLWIGTWNTQRDKPLEGTSNTISVIYKSPLGHTILYDDTRGSEKIRIIDRAGQIIEMSCGLRDDIVRRGTGNKIDGGAKSLIDTVTSAGIKIIDLAGNKIELHSETGASYLELEAVGDMNVNVAGQYNVNITGAYVLNIDGDYTITTATNINLNAEAVIINSGVSGVHNQTSNPIDLFTGAPQPGIPDLLAP